MATKEKERELERDGVVYLATEVRTDKKCVGLAPRIKFKLDGDSYADALEKMTVELGEEQLFKLADAQLNTSTQNRVRAKYNKDKFSASQTVAAIASGEITTDDIMSTQKQRNVSFTEAAGILMGVGKNAVVDSEHVHWDCLIGTVPAVASEEAEESEE